MNQDYINGYSHAYETVLKKITGIVNCQTATDRIKEIMTTEILKLEVKKKDENELRVEKLEALLDAMAGHAVTKFCEDSRREREDNENNN